MTFFLFSFRFGQAMEEADKCSNRGCGCQVASALPVQSCLPKALASCRIHAYLPSPICLPFAFPLPAYLPSYQHIPPSQYSPHQESCRGCDPNTKTRAGLTFRMGLSRPGSETVHALGMLPYARAMRCPVLPCVCCLFPAMRCPVLGYAMSGAEPAIGLLYCAMSSTGLCDLRY